MTGTTARWVVVVAWGILTMCSGTAAAQEKAPPRGKRPVAAVPAREQLLYRSFTVEQLARDDQQTPARRTGRGAQEVVPNTANVIEEIFRRGLGPIVVGARGRSPAGAGGQSTVVLASQPEVFAALHNGMFPPASGGGDAARSRSMGRPVPDEVGHLFKNLIALKINMLICGNGITVNDPGWRFADLSLSPDWGVPRRPWIYDNCEQCNAVCPGPCFMTAELMCRCYLEHLRTAEPGGTAVDQLSVPRRLRDLAAFADGLLADWDRAPVGDLEAVAGALELINAAFVSDLPFRGQDIVQWDGEGGRLVLSSVRSLSEVPFLVAE